MDWLKYHWGSNENATFQDTNNIKNIITSKFEEKMWGEKDLEAKRKLRCYKEVINPNMEDESISLF